MIYSFHFRKGWQTATLKHVKDKKTGRGMDTPRPIQNSSGLRPQLPWPHRSLSQNSRGRNPQPPGLTPMVCVVFYPKQQKEWYSRTVDGATIWDTKVAKCTGHLNLDRVHCVVCPGLRGCYPIPRLQAEERNPSFHALRERGRKGERKGKHGVITTRGLLSVGRSVGV